MAQLKTTIIFQPPSPQNRNHSQMRNENRKEIKITQCLNYQKGVASWKAITKDQHYCREALGVGLFWFEQIWFIQICASSKCC